MPTTTTRIVRCRYIRLSGEQCTREVADPNAEIRLCTKHLARALELIHSKLN